MKEKNAQRMITATQERETERTKNFVTTLDNDTRNGRWLRPPVRSTELQWRSGRQMLDSDCDNPRGYGGSIYEHNNGSAHML